MAKSTWRGMRPRLIRAMLIAAAIAAPHAAAATALADASGSDATLCARAIEMAAGQTGVPADLLHAIARVESGRRGAPWPWALNVGGTGTWHDSRAALEAHVLRLQAAGETSFDIGCFQINTRWHGASFESLKAIADPGANALYAARFLLRLHAEFGTWEGAAGAFHSRTPALAEAYLARVAAHRARAPAPAQAPRPAQGAAEAPGAGPRTATAYPLLHPARGRGAAPGSLVPAMAARAPFLSGWAAP